MSKKFSNLKLDKSKDSKEVEASGLKVTKLPTVFFLKPNGEVIEQVNGYVNAETFLPIMQKVLDTPLAKTAPKAKEDKKESSDSKSTAANWSKPLDDAKANAKKANKTLLVKLGAPW